MMIIIKIIIIILIIIPTLNIVVGTQTQYENIPGG
jgi:hypothetical protein